MTAFLRRRVSRRHAFTLLEIMLVVAIIALLLGSAFMIFGDRLAIGQDARLKADFQGISTSLQTYRMMADDQYPTTEQGLQALVTMPTADPKPSKWYHQMDHLPKDPWGRDYVYICPGKHNPDSFDLYSKGKDGVDGTPDDKVMWEYIK